MDEYAAGTGTRLVMTSGMTNVRWRIFFLILGTVAINYIDRASLSVAMPMISREFAIPPAIQGLLLSSFFWTYCFMQIPGGMLADRFLPRSVIARATIGWGAFASLAASSTGWITPVSLFAIMMLMSRVFGRKAFRTSSGSISPQAFTETNVASHPICSRRLQLFMTALCSIVEVIT